jgi:hypothetical protein
MLCISMNTNSVFIISDVVYMMKKNNMILNVHSHCSTLYTKYVLKKYTLEFRILFSVLYNNK